MSMHECKTSPDLADLAEAEARIQQRMSNVPWMLSLIAATHSDMAREASRG